jgi:hypothetical protein
MKIGNLWNAQRSASKRTKPRSVRQVFGKCHARESDFVGVFFQQTMDPQCAIFIGDSSDIPKPD